MNPSRLVQFGTLDLSRTKFNSDFEFGGEHSLIIWQHLFHAAWQRCFFNALFMLPDTTLNASFDSSLPKVDTSISKWGSNNECDLKDRSDDGIAWMVLRRRVIQHDWMQSANKTICEWAFTWIMISRSTVELFLVMWAGYFTGGRDNRDCGNLRPAMSWNARCLLRWANAWKTMEKWEREDERGYFGNARCMQLAFYALSIVEILYAKKGVHIFTYLNIIRLKKYYLYASGKNMKKLKKKIFLNSKQCWK